MKEKFLITGMSCSACSAYIDRHVGTLDGVASVSVNLVSNSMVVDYNETITSSSVIMSTVIEGGFGITSENSVKPTNNGTTKNSNSYDDELTSMKNRLIVSFIFFIPLMYISMGHMVMLPIPHIFMQPKGQVAFAFTQFLLTIPIAFTNRKYFISGYKTLVKRAPNMDALVAIGSGSAIVYGVYAIYALSLGTLESIHLYFESAGTILTLITLGKYFEARSKQKTSQSINKLINLAPKTAIVERNGVEHSVNASDIIKGDIIIVKTGSAVAVDGTVTFGSGYVDQSAITGESIPVEKKIGDNVTSATINTSGYFKFRAEKVGDDTTLAQIIKLVDNASNSKAPISKLADSISAVFVPIVIVLAILTGCYWYFTMGFEFALSMMITVLVISCPCALGLATPLAIMIGTGKSAEHGILVKSAEALELASKTSVVVLDKTGTITSGTPQVTDIIATNGNELLQIASSMEKGSEHPIAKAIIKKANDTNIPQLEISEFKSLSGLGIECIIADKKYLSGNAKLMTDNNINISNFTTKVEQLANDGKTPIYFACNDEVIGVIAVADTVKPESLNAIKQLQSKGLEVVMLTGDHKETANAIAKSIGIGKVYAEVLPQDKDDVIQQIQAAGKRCIMVGDGINDAPALTRADVGIAIGAGTDVAIESADIVLVRNSLQDVVATIDLSYAVVRNIKQNLFWAFFYNIAFIPVAAGVLYPFGIKLNPMFAAAAMSLSSVSVVANALRLKLFTVEEINTEKEKPSIMKKTIYVNGMSCNHCKMSVEKVLNNLEGVSNAEVNLDEKLATADILENVSDDVLVSAITDAGFEVVEVK